MQKTGQEYWNAFWENIKLPQAVDYGFKNDRVIAETIKKFVPPAGPGQTAAEIGCAPGKWLVFLNKKLGYRVVGYEYLEQAAKTTEQNLALAGVQAGDFKIIQADFLKTAPEPVYDAVISLGFIEHFDNYDEVMRKHAAFVRPGGCLVLGVPSFKGINYIFAKLVDRYLENKILPAHNLKAMSLEMFRRFGIANGLKTLFAGYVGGFEPALFNSPAITNRLAQFAARGAIKACGLLFGDGNNALTGSYIIAVYKK